MTSQIRNTFLDKKMLGTLFPEEEITKKDNFHNQIARDDKGHKRFHGAFEGGFQAGYNNTVGSKEGWAPQTFISSRSKRAVVNQNIDSFMDEEDKGRQKLGVNVTIAPEYDSFAVNEVNLLKQQLGGREVPDELICKTNTSLGYRLLKQTKITIPKDSELQEYEYVRLSKSNNTFQGLGYKSNLDDNVSSLEQKFLTAIKRSLTLKTNEEEFDQDKRKKDNRMLMNGSEPVEKEEYLTHLEEEDEKPRKQVKSNVVVVIKDSKQLCMDFEEHSITVPKDYDPYYRAKALLQKGLDESEIFIIPKSKMSRAEVFEETAQSIRKDAMNKKFVKASTIQQPTVLNQSDQSKQLPLRQLPEVEVPEGPAMQLFPHNADRQKKYRKFVEQLKAGIQVTDLDKDDVQDFQRLYDMFQVQSKHVVAAVPKIEKPEEQHKMFSRRSFKRWIPDDRFCKRMGVRPPFSEEERELIAKVNLRIEQRQPNMASDSNRDFLRMDKKVFTPGGIYQESNEEIGITQNKLVFDPTQLGLPLSFKSSSFDRNQQERMVQIENQERAKQPDRPKKRHDKYTEDGEHIQNRVSDQKLFDFIFGD